MSEHPINFRCQASRDADGTCRVDIAVTNIRTPEEANRIGSILRKPVRDAVLALYPGARTEGALDN